MDSKYLSILVCPVCKSPLHWEKQKNELHCKACQLAYPIEDRVPVMLESRARKIEQTSPSST